MVEVSLAILLTVDLFVIFLGVLSLVFPFAGIIGIIVSIFVLMPNLVSLTDAVMLPLTVVSVFISIICLLLGLKIHD